MSRGKKIFRADQVGSLLRPERLKQARQDRQDGKITAAALRQVEDECIRDAVRRQEDAGLEVVTDGDFRRASFHTDFLSRISNVAVAKKAFDNLFHILEHDNSPVVFEVTGKIAPRSDITEPDFDFLASATTRTAKAVLPSPTFVHARGGRETIDRVAYPDLDQFYDDLAAAFRAEINALAEAGCRYVQLDEVHYTFFCDPRLVAMYRARGDDPQDLGLRYAKLINDSFRGVDDELLRAVHLCRGNRRSGWVAKGGYEPVAEVLFNNIDADVFLLEYDTERAGGFEPLRFVPKGKIVVLGLVSSKTCEMEHPDALKRRIDEAARFVPIAQLALSPQCGFASSVAGNLITPEAQWAKLAMVVKVAEDVWGR